MPITNRIKRRRPGLITAGFVLTAALAFAGVTGSANAEEHRWEHHEGHHQDWNGGYYRAPPVVYGQPYYYAPPVIWGPGLNIIIR